MITDCPSQNQLSIIESAKLENCEAIIEEGLQTFIDVGSALFTIRDEKLYRRDYDTFESYCLERWSIKRAHAYRLIDASKVVENLSPIGDIPKTESQCRELGKLPDEEQAEAWGEVIEICDEPTAAKVKEVVDRRRGPQSCNTGNNELVYAIGVYRTRTQSYGRHRFGPS